MSPFKGGVVCLRILFFLYSVYYLKSLIPCLVLYANFYFVQEKKGKLKWNLNKRSSFTFICFLISAVLSSLNESMQIETSKSQSKNNSPWTRSWSLLLILDASIFSCPYCLHLLASYFGKWGSWDEKASSESVPWCWRWILSSPICISGPWHIEDGASAPSPHRGVLTGTPLL